jgi:hypothetical protein
MKATRKKEYAEKRIRKAKEIIREPKQIECKTIAIKASNYFNQGTREVYRLGHPPITVTIRIPDTYNITLLVSPETSIKERYRKFMRMCPDLMKYEKSFGESVGN